MDVKILAREYGVLTGDVINSKSTPSKEWLPVLKGALSELGQEPHDWEIYRGDSFQLQVKAQEGYKAALYLKSAIKKFKKLNVRIAIGIGEVAYKPKNITEANGTAFVYSGECFDELKSTLAIKSAWPEFDKEINLYFELALLTIDHWSANSAEVVNFMLKTPGVNQQMVAKKFKKAQSTISATLSRAGYYELMKLDQRYNYLINQK